MNRIALKLAYFCLLVPTMAAFAQNPMWSGAKIGGPCSYHEYPGQATIIQIKKTEQSKNQRNLVPYEGYEVEFTFKSDDIHQDKLATELLKKPFVYFLRRSAYEIYPGQKYLAKYGIRVGMTYPGTVRVISTGTCAPILFKLEGLDPNDLFESQLSR
ncbi:hypothetical protein [Burkholderia ubonensis]|uniref:hypothetical protein n=1 Tax=Burkholderia ubonensis TaxID=101571 RepID=UPI000AE897A4|nr:hypothetical protein [Burkholderia ubonensis]